MASKASASGPKNKGKKSTKKPKAAHRQDEYTTQSNEKLVQTTLRVTKLPSTCAENDLLNFFQQSTPVESLKITRSRVAYVNFTSNENGNDFFMFFFNGKKN